MNALEALNLVVANSWHPVVQRYLVAFLNWTDELDGTTRDQLLGPTLQLDIDTCIRWHRVSIEHFDEQGDLTEEAEDWIARELIGFESTYRGVSLTEIAADILVYNEDPTDWPQFKQEEA